MRWFGGCVDPGNVASASQKNNCRVSCRGSRYLAQLARCERGYAKTLMRSSLVARLHYELVAALGLHHKRPSRAFVTATWMPGQNTNCFQWTPVHPATRPTSAVCPLAQCRSQKNIEDRPEKPAVTQSAWGQFASRLFGRSRDRAMCGGGVVTNRSPIDVKSCGEAHANFRAMSVLRA